MVGIDVPNSLKASLYRSHSYAPNFHSSPSSSLEAYLIVLSVCFCNFSLCSRICYPSAVTDGDRFLAVRYFIVACAFANLSEHLPCLAVIGNCIEDTSLHTDQVLGPPMRQQFSTGPLRSSARPVIALPLVCFGLLSGPLTPPVITHGASCSHRLIFSHCHRRHSKVAYQFIDRNLTAKSAHRFPLYNPHIPP